MTEPNDESLKLRRLIEKFILEISDVQKGDDRSGEKGGNPIEREDIDQWISEAASRVELSMKGGNPIKLATHTIKPIHPDAKGANLFVDSVKNVSPLVSSASLKEGFYVDVVGNAAYKLKQYKFLAMRNESGKRLIDLALEKDVFLEEALDGSQDKGERLLEVFSSLKKSRLSSSPKIKQVYWLVGDDPADDDAYHLLAPLYATSLAHQVFQTINEDRFGDATKEARKARRERAYSETGYRDYPGLAVQKFGGTKPQNISQLNSERGGNNYLLASLPPRWNSADVRVPLYVNSALQHFGRRPTVRRLLRDLRRFLESDPSATYGTRDKRDDFNAALMDELMLFSMELVNLPPGWSADENCRLPEEEQFWLDPGRAELDEDFRRKRHDVDWSAEIRRRFATWLNGQLERSLPVGDVEHRQWSQALKTDASFQHWMDEDQRWVQSLERELDAWQGGLAHD